MNRDATIGTVVGGYRVATVIGRGSMGTVYLAESATGEQVALKLLAPELADDERFRRRFLRESQLVGSLHHPHIVPTVAAGDDGALYLAMAYLDGIDLRELLRREGPLDPERTLSLLAPVADALDTAHREGVVHRDVKPGNVLVTADGSGEHAWVCDFGLAKHLSSPGSLTGSRGFVGTIDYVSPEQIEGGEIDGRADVYSLGCLLFECLAGVRPFDRDSELAVVFAHLNEPPPRLTDHRPGSAPGLDAVLARALAKRPAARFATCGELVAAAGAAVRGERPATARGRKAVAVAAVAAAVGAAVVLLARDGGGSSAPPSITAAAIGGVPLGHQLAWYRQRFGVPYRLDVAQTPDLPVLIFNNRELSVYFERGSGKGFEVTTWNRRFRTAAGVGPCSTVQQLKSAYGSALHVSKPNAQPSGVYGYTAGKIFFAVNDLKHVTAVAIYRPGPDHYLPMASFLALQETACI